MYSICLFIPDIRLPHSILANSTMEVNWHQSHTHKGNKRQGLGNLMYGLDVSNQQAQAFKHMK